LRRRVGGAPRSASPLAAAPRRQVSLRLFGCLRLRILNLLEHLAHAGSHGFPLFRVRLAVTTLEAFNFSGIEVLVHCSRFLAANADHGQDRRCDGRCHHTDDDDRETSEHAVVNGALLLADALVAVGDAPLIDRTRPSLDDAASDQVDRRIPL
jgi:hypothetical protein